MAESMGDAELAPGTEKTEVLEIRCDEGTEVFLEEALEREALTPLVINFLSMEKEGANICAPFVAHDHRTEFVEDGCDNSEYGEVGCDGDVAVEGTIGVQGKEVGGECSFDGKKRNICFLCEFP